MRTIREIEMSLIDMPVIFLEKPVFHFLQKYSSFLYGSFEKQEYMQIPLDKKEVEKIVKDAKKKLSDEYVKRVLWVIEELTDSGVPKKEIWLKINYDYKISYSSIQQLTKTKITPIKNSNIKIDDDIFDFITNYATYLYNDEGNPPYWKIEGYSYDIAKIERDMEEEFRKEKLKKLQNILSIIKKYKEKNGEDLWFQIV